MGQWNLEKKKKTIQALFVSLQLSLFASWGNWNLTYLMNTTTLKYICDHFHSKMYYFIADNMPLKITLKAAFNPELSIELIILLGVHVSQQMCNQTGCLISDITHFYTWSKLVWFQVVIEEHPVTSFHLAEPVWQPLTSPNIPVHPIYTGHLFSALLFVSYLLKCHGRERGPSVTYFNWDTTRVCA